MRPAARRTARAPGRDSKRIHQRLYSIDKTTGVGTPIGAATGISSTMDLAFDCDGRLWATANGGLWTVDTTTGVATAQPSITGVSEGNFMVMGMFFDSSCHMLVTTYTNPGTLYAVDATGSGDVSSTHIRWSVNQVPEGIGSPVIVGTHLYRLHTPNILKCWEAATGKQVYAERLEGLSSTWASPVVDPNGRIYFASGGKSYVIQSGPEFRVLAVNSLGDANHPSPAVANSRMFLEGMKELFCIGKLP